MTGDAVIEPGTSRREVHRIMGQPVASGEPGGLGLMRIEHAWDSWLLPDGRVLHCVYDGTGGGAGTITTEDPSEPEPVRVELRVYADYYQFYVQDLASSCDTSTIWDEPGGSEAGLVAGDGLVAIGTKRYNEVPVRVELYAADPGFSWEGIDRVSEAGLVVTTRLGVGMPISVSPLPVIEAVASGTYGLRSLAWGLDTVVDDWNGDDH